MKALVVATLLIGTLLTTACGKQMDEFVSGVQRTLPPMLDILDDGMSYARLGVAQESVSSATYEASVIVGSPVVQVESTSVSVNVQLNRTSFYQ